MSKAVWGRKDETSPTAGMVTLAGKKHNKEIGVESQQRGSGFLKEFREFTAFLSTLWGLLAGISVFFPLSSVFIKVIPLRAYETDGVFDQLSPALITAVATVVTLFLVLSTFGRREEFKGVSTKNARHQAWISMGVSMIALIAYMTIHQIYEHLGVCRIYRPHRRLLPNNCS